VKTVLIPIDNVKDLEEIPKNVSEKLKIIPVSTVREVFAHALVSSFKPILVEDENLENEVCGHKHSDHEEPSFH
jgi:ATP-dependent Lon protease